MFESPDDLMAESHFQMVAEIDIRCLTVMATIEIFVDIVNAEYIWLATYAIRQSANDLKEQVSHVCLKSV